MRGTVSHRDSLDSRALGGRRRVGRLLLEHRAQRAKQPTGMIGDARGEVWAVTPDQRDREQSGHQPHATGSWPPGSADPD